MRASAMYRVFFGWETSTSYPSSVSFLYRGAMLVVASIATRSTPWDLRKAGTSSFGILLWASFSPSGPRMVAYVYSLWTSSPETIELIEWLERRPDKRLLMLSGRFNNCESFIRWSAFLRPFNYILSKQRTRPFPNLSSEEG